LAKAAVALVFEVGQLPHRSNQPPNLWLPHAALGALRTPYGGVGVSAGGLPRVERSNAAIRRLRAS
jgi:hypothetical protein